MLAECRRLLGDLKNFLNWNDCERTFAMNLIVASMILPFALLSYLLYPQTFPYLGAMLIGLVLITLANLYEIKLGRVRSYVIYVQVVFIAGCVAFGASLLGSVSSGMIAMAMLLPMCAYPILGSQYATWIVLLNIVSLGGVIIGDFILEIWPYYWARDLSGVGHSGNEVRALLSLTKPGKVILEFFFLSSLLWTMLLLRFVERQLLQKSRSLKQTHEMLRDSKSLSDQLLRDAQEKQQELQACISQLLVVVQQVAEGNLNVTIPDFGDQPMGRLARGFAHMVTELRSSKTIDEKNRLKEQQQTQELQSYIQQLLDVVQEVGKGNLNVTPPDFGDRPLGKLARGLGDMILKQNLNRLEETRQKQMMARATALIENSQSSVMMLDQQGIVRYLNPAARHLLRSLKQYLSLPVNKIIDNSYEVLIQDAHFRRVLVDPQKLPYSNELKLGEESVYIVATAVYDTDKSWLGTMLSWEVITEEKGRSERNFRLQRQVKTIAQQLSDASMDLLGVSEQMADVSTKTSSQAKKVVYEAKEIQTSIHHIAAALEEMSATLASKEKLVEHSTQMSNQAVESSRMASETIQALGKSSISIGTVVQLISRIAQQTNILALNATIQATRAGEAGRGFGVVAREVKALAQQTSEATREISTQVNTIQADSQQAVEAIHQVSGIIERMNQISGHIHRAIEEQTSATHEIAQRMEEASMATQAIANHINGVAQVAESTTHGVQKGREAILLVDTIVTNLNGLVTAIR